MTPVEIARELVRIPSVNPDGDPGTGQTGETECATWIAKFFNECGARTELRQVLPGRPNVLARFAPEHSGKPKILFAPHTDTVSIRGMTIDPFGGEIRNGRLYGRGATDTKGPMAAMMWALREAAPMLPSLPFDVLFAGLAGEEAAQIGAKALAAEEKFDFVMVGEPTALNVVHTHKGSSWITLRTHGHAVHSSCPESGENAIYKMCAAIDCIRHEVAPALAGLHHAILGSPTVSVGTISGGSKANIVPDACEAVVDMRTIPGQDLSIFEKFVRTRVPDIEMTATVADPLFTDPCSPLIQTLKACGAQALGAPWFCDAAVFAKAGCPSIAIGPGSIAQAHTADEFIALDDLKNGAEFFLKFLRSLASA